MQRAGMIAVAAIAAFAAAGCGGKAAVVATPPAVTVAKPLSQDVNDYLDFSGNTVAVDSVTLVARVEGFLDQIHFVDGSTVKKGTLLFTIQQAQYKAELQQAIAQVSAQKASLWHARTEFARYTHLLAQDAATQTEVDHWKFEKESAEAFNCVILSTNPKSYPLTDCSSSACGSRGIARFVDSPSGGFSFGRRQLRDSRSRCRARANLDITVPIGIPTTSAISL